MPVLGGSGECLGLQRVELGLVDGAAVEQFLGFRDVLGRGLATAGAGAGDVLDVGVGLAAASLAAAI